MIAAKASEKLVNFLCENCDSEKLIQDKVCTQKIFDGITTVWIDKRQPIQHRLQFKKQV